MSKPKPIGRVWNASKRWAKDITSHAHMVETIYNECDLDDELYVQDYNDDTKGWTTPLEMGYQNLNWD